MKKQKEVNLLAIFAIVLVVLAVGAFVAFSYYQHMCAQTALSAGNYETAAAYARRDLIFSSREKQILAIPTLKAEGRSEELAAAMEAFPDEPIVKQIREEMNAAQDEACFAEAWKLLDDGELDAAESRMKEMIDPARKDSSEFYATLQRKRADRLMLAQDFPAALEAYRKCSAMPEDALILEALEQNDLLGAAKQMVDALKQGKTLLDEQTWLAQLEAKQDALDPGDIGANLDMMNILACFREDTPAETLGESLTANYSKWWWPLVADKVSPLESCKLYAAIEKPEDVLSLCGTAPAGKILVLYQQSTLPKREQSYAVDYDMMRLLPKDRLPASLEEVEYLIWVTCNFNDFGTYVRTLEDGGSSLRKGVQITGMVRCLHMPDQKELYRSKTLLGGNQMEVDSPDDTWVSGTAPDLSEALAAALNAIPVGE